MLPIPAFWVTNKLFNQVSLFAARPADVQKCTCRLFRRRGLGTEEREVLEIAGKQNRRTSLLKPARRFFKQILEFLNLRDFKGVKPLFVKKIVCFR
jgi:hypothetical protein